MPNSIDTDAEFYATFIGKSEFSPELVITQSSDFNCGAICNELEYARKTTQYYTTCLYVDTAESENLDILINSFVDLPRRNRVEADSIYRDRYKCLVVAQTNYRRCTPWAIRDAILHFIDAPETVQVIENFDDQTNYFQIRIEGAEVEGVIFIDSVETGFIDQNFIGGSGVGAIISYLGEMIDRIKCSGVDYDIFFISQDRFTVVGNARIGAIQKYIIGNATVLGSNSFTKIGNAQVV